MGVSKGKDSHMYRHGMCGTSVYNAWDAIKQRCLNVNNKFYMDYGGRGITICNEWKNDFMSFYKYVGLPFVGASIDRIDNNGNYEPGNVRWATKAEQQANKRKNKNTSSKYKHVYWSNTYSVWQAKGPRPDRKYLGSFKKETDACNAVKNYLKGVK